MPPSYSLHFIHSTTHPTTCAHHHPAPTQTYHVCTSPVVQAAWADGQELHVWGMVYDVATGKLKVLEGPINSQSDVNLLRIDGVGYPINGSAADTKAPKKRAAAAAPAAAPPAKKRAPAAKKAPAKKTAAKQKA